MLSIFVVFLKDQQSTLLKTVIHKRPSFLYIWWEKEGVGRKTREEGRGRREGEGREICLDMVNCAKVPTVEL